MTTHAQRTKVLLPPVIVLILLCIGGCDEGSTPDACPVDQVECDGGCCEVCSADCELVSEIKEYPGGKCRPGNLFPHLGRAACGLPQSRRAAGLLRKSLPALSLVRQ